MHLVKTDTQLSSIFSRLKSSKSSDSSSSNFASLLPYLAYGTTGIIAIGFQLVGRTSKISTDTLYQIITVILSFVVGAYTTWRDNPVTKKAKFRKEQTNKLVKKYEIKWK